MKSQFSTQRRGGAEKNPKGIKSFSPALTRQRLRWVVVPQNKFLLRIGWGEGGRRPDEVNRELRQTRERGLTPPIFPRKLRAWLKRMTNSDPFTFSQPANPDAKVWRYLDLAKAIYLFQTGKLVFCRLDSFGDKHEGSITIPMLHNKEKTAKQLGAADISEILAVGLRCVRKIGYASCWHLNNSESEAMWQLYCPNNQGIAIQTTYKKLGACSLKWDKAIIGLVTYLDYQLEKFQMENFLNALMHKRESFKHESEVRVLITRYDLLTKLNPPTLEDLKKREVQFESQPRNIQIDWNLEENIDGIFVNPYAPAWQSEMIQNLIRSIRPSLADKVKMSNLSGLPVF
jgi:hypothetical protein